MHAATERPMRPVFKVVIAMTYTTIFVAILAIPSDLVESFWHATRFAEAWELDDLMLAVGIGIAVGLVAATMQILSLHKQVVETQHAATYDQEQSESSAHTENETSDRKYRRSIQEIEQAIARLQRDTTTAVEPSKSELHDDATIRASERILTVEALEWVLGTEPNAQSQLAAI
jgi:hypothetical protein